MSNGKETNASDTPSISQVCKDEGWGEREKYVKISREEEIYQVSKKHTESPSQAISLQYLQLSLSLPIHQLIGEGLEYKKEITYINI